MFLSYRPGPLGAVGRFGPLGGPDPPLFGDSVLDVESLAKVYDVSESG